MVEAMRGLSPRAGDLKHIVIRAWPHWVDTRALALMMNDRVGKHKRRHRPHQRFDSPARRPAAADVHFARARHGWPGARAKTFPDGYVTRHRSPIPGRDFVLFLVPARQH